MEKRVIRALERAQRNEITEQGIYESLARLQRDPENRRLLESIAGEEGSHYAVFRSITGKDIAPDRVKQFLYVCCGRLLGLNFALRQMEKGEVLAQAAYEAVKGQEPRLGAVIEDEHRHEVELLSLINEEALVYTGSVVLGLNDALVELTGALAGFTLALQRSRLIAVVGAITGIAAASSMMAAEYLSTKEEGIRDAWKASVYTGIAYSITVALLVLPFVLFANPFMSLGVTALLAILIIFIFNYYISVAKGLPFRRRFVEMVCISMGVALLNYGIGLLLKNFTGSCPV
ncbi:MAG: VIT1/CCC1 transporter family protein [Deltaproteobacteria bacterium]